jgi:hypothetical protein
MVYQRFLLTVTLLVATTVLLPLSSGARLQERGAVVLFSDPGYTSCSIVDDGNMQHMVFVVHIDDSGVEGLSALRIDNETTLTYLGESVPWLSFGDTRLGLTVSYGQCIAGTILVCSVNYMGHATSPSCSYIYAAPDGSGLPVNAVDCLPVLVYPALGRLVVNPDQSCLCVSPVPTEGTSWGRIKALYKE